MKNRNLLESFICAFSGVSETIKKERNFKIQVCSAICALLLAMLLKISVIEFICVLVSISMVLTAELINTAIEAAIDLFSGGKYHIFAKAAKDAAAGAVLIASVNAVAVGVAVFLKRLINVFF